MTNFIKVLEILLRNSPNIKKISLFMERQMYSKYLFICEA
jgi:hypothetical protein